MHYSELTQDELEALLVEQAKSYDKIRKEGRTVDIARGKPSARQLDAVMGVFDEFSSAVEVKGSDWRNYGDLTGVPALKKIFSDILGVPEAQLVVAGGGSLGMMYDALQRAMQFGVLGGTPWNKLEKVKFLCPAPGYDRHFAICEHFGIEMIAVPMLDDGPDMNVVESLAIDEAVKGIWCVPRFSNPTGAVYSDAVVSRLAAMRATPDFRIFWDNAYAVHVISEDAPPLKNVLDACALAGNPDRALLFTSTAKILFPGGSTAAFGASVKNVDDMLSHYGFQTICPNKVWETLSAAYIRDFKNLKEIMRIHGDILAPKFKLVTGALEGGIGDLGIAKWTSPKGGYFVSLDVLPGTARRVYELCKGAGLTLTPAGATFPYGIDDNDTNLRIAPTFPEMDELEASMRILVCCIRLAAFSKLAGK